MPIQLIRCDEYNQKSIEATGNSVPELVKKAKAAVNHLNMDNAFTADDKIRNWEALYLEIINDAGDLIDDACYTGKNGSGVHCVLPIDEKANMVVYGTVPGIKVRAYLGELDGKARYAADERGRQINSIDNPVLFEHKTIFYVRRS